MSGAVTVACLKEFLRSGTLAGSAAEEGVSVSLGGQDHLVSDTEWLTGCVGFAQTLVRYATARATHSDRRSIRLCRNMTGALMSKMLEFSFRNGPLRRKFDGLKYAHKRLEDMLYELSLGTSDADDVSDSASAAAEAAATLVDDSLFDAVRGRMDAYDAAREDVIKRSRDVQKLSKQAIFALHKSGEGGRAKATKNLSDAAAKAKAIAAELLVGAGVSLRKGSYGNALEEWAEGRIFQLWLENSAGELASREMLCRELPITADEYLGGLVDMTGEVGRWAVARATSRDAAGVQLALVTSRAVTKVVMAQQAAGGGGRAKKKLGQLESNTRKMEILLYELSLRKSTGRAVSAGKMEVVAAAE